MKKKWKTEPRFKKGDLIREGGSIYRVLEINTDGQGSCKVQLVVVRTWNGKPYRREWEIVVDGVEYTNAYIWNCRKATVYDVGLKVWLQLGSVQRRNNV